jgi:hypothetical protein
VEGCKGVERCQQLMEVEAGLGFRSSFNFVPEGEYATPKELRSLLVKKGFEVGVHDLKHDGKLYRSRDQFSSNARRINEYLKEWNAVGFRSGFMLHELDWLHELNILYDASTFDTDPFEPQPDGANTIFPFRVTNNDNRPSYIELPYTLVQDFTLFVLMRERSIGLWKEKADWVAQRGGMVLLNTHPDYMSFVDGECQRDEFDISLYKQFLHYMRNTYQDAYWHALPSEVARFWNAWSCAAAKLGNEAIKYTT